MPFNVKGLQSSGFNNVQALNETISQSNTALNVLKALLKAITVATKLCKEE